MNEIKEYAEKIFEDIKHLDENDNEYWLASKLQTVLDYKEWRKFEGVIDKAKIACKIAWLIQMNNLSAPTNCQ